MRNGQGRNTHANRVRGGGLGIYGGGVRGMRNLTIVLLLVVVTFFMGRCYQRNVHDKSNAYIDTVVKYDTIRDSIPVPVKKWITRVDSIPYPVVLRDTDTVVVRVPIPIERKEFRKTNYYAVIEGYKPDLVYIETYDKTTTVDRLETRKVKPRWGVGINAGYGTSINGKPSPYIGVGVQYNILTF